jgi:hypothetical protein
MGEIFLAVGTITYSDDPARDTGIVARLLRAAGHRVSTDIFAAAVSREAACLPLLSLLPPRGDRWRKRSESAVRQLAVDLVGRSVEVPGQAPPGSGAIEAARWLRDAWFRICDTVDGWLVEDGSRPGQLFLAMLAGEPVGIGHADEEERSVLVPATAAIMPRDTIDRWSLIAIRGGTVRATTIHALGHRITLDDVWITSPLTSFDPGSMMVGTSSGHTYRLGETDSPAIGTERRDHLAFALRKWGYDVVR